MLFFTTYYSIFFIISSIAQLLMTVKAYNNIQPLRNICKLNMKLDKTIILYTPNCLRVHDNPILRNNVNYEVFTHLYVEDRQLSSQLDQSGSHANSAVRDLSANLKLFGIDLIKLEGKTVDVLLNYLSIVGDVKKMVFCRTAIEPLSSMFRELEDGLLKAEINFEYHWDNISKFSPSTQTNSDLIFNLNKDNYNSKNINIPYITNDMAKYIFSKHAFSNTRVFSSNAVIEEMGGESLALRLLGDYVQFGEVSFTNKYADLYVKQATSPEQQLARSRLALVPAIGQHFFQGEVLSGLLSPLLAHGCLSPRLLQHARSILRPAIFSEIPVVCRLQNEAVRKDWHARLAYYNDAATLLKEKQEMSLLNSIENNNHINNKINELSEWKFSFRHWKGFIVREGVMTDSSSSNSDGQRSPPNSKSTTTAKPIIVLVHGFGGSITQFTGLARLLSQQEFHVVALDLLGFGQSEKPPISYDQYFWRDQVVDFVRRSVVTDTFSTSTDDLPSVILAGNSIGGFTATAAAAVLASEGLCQGLVLFNSAGRILEGQGLTVTPQAELFGPYKGPASELLRLFGKAIFSLLQPRIATTCEWLYPTNRDPVHQYLAAGIYRDSCDPGAADVIAAGGKLPTPIPINDLFGQYLGPVLIAQGKLDPLNDAVGRAKFFEGIRSGVTVDLLPLGHCPMDEGPQLVSDSIMKWIETAGIIAKPPLLPIQTTNQLVAG